MARPRTVDRAKLMQNVCERIAQGELVKVAATAEGTSARQIRQWAEEDEAFAPLYARARVQQAHAMAEQVIAIADDADIAPDHKRVMVDARKWLTSKIAPKLYSEKAADVSVNVQVNAQTWTFGDKQVAF